MVHSCGSGSPPGFATWRASLFGARVSFFPVRPRQRQHVQTVGWSDHVPGQDLVNRCCQCDNVCAYRARFDTKSNTPLLQTVEHATKILLSLRRQPRMVYPPVEGSEWTVRIALPSFPSKSSVSPNAMHSRESRDCIKNTESKRSNRLTTNFRQLLFTKVHGETLRNNACAAFGRQGPSR